MRKMLSVVVCLVLATAVGGYVTVADGHEEAAKEVMELAYEQWEAFQNKNAKKAMAQLADEYTEFNPDSATRLDGKTLNMRLAEAEVQGSGEGILAEMLNPKVQVHGDVAILSYNYYGITKEADGTTESTRAKSTRVYVKMDGKWKLVHANFGADPKPE